jgi:hypothetical protein
MKNSELPIFHPTYFPSILQFSEMMKSQIIVFERHDNFLKQTYRNRCYIYGANGKQLLNVPVQKISGKQLYKDVKIDYNANWQNEHLKSLESAYNSSPFYEFYIDDLLEIFTKKTTYLFDLNIKIFEILNALIESETLFVTSEAYEIGLKNDFRVLVNAKKDVKNDFPMYTQVFSSKHGFLSNLSILDLLFMKGPATALYLNLID